MRPRRNCLGSSHLIAVELTALDGVGHFSKRGRSWFLSLALFVLAGVADLRSDSSLFRDLKGSSGSAARALVIPVSSCGRGTSSSFSATFERTPDTPIAIFIATCARTLDSSCPSTCAYPRRIDKLLHHGEFAALGRIDPRPEITCSIQGQSLPASHGGVGPTKEKT